MHLLGNNLLLDIEIKKRDWSHSEHLHTYFCYKINQEFWTSCLNSEHILIKYIKTPTIQDRSEAETIVKATPGHSS